MTQILLPDGDRIVLHGLSAPEAERGSIVRFHSSGRPRWVARPPQGPAQDAFVAIQLQGGALVADSFQGLNIRIDLDSGALLESGFVK